MLTIGDMMGFANEEKAFDASVPHLIRFELDSSGNISSMINNKKVYREWSSQDEISAGDCWLCSLTYSVKGNNYFAKGLRLVDAEDLIKENENLVHELAEYMLSYAPASVEKVCMPSMQSRINELAQVEAERISSEKQTEDQTKIDELNMTVGELEEKNSKLSSEIEDREATIESLNASIEHLRGRISELESRPVVSETNAVIIPSFTIDVLSEGVTRISKDEICSRSFKDGRYRVRFGITGRRMTIVEHPDGETICSNNTIRIPHLGDIVPFDSIGRMMHLDVPGGMTISLL